MTFATKFLLSKWTPADVVVWTCVWVFVITSALTLLNIFTTYGSLDYEYRNKLFYVLVVEIVVAGVGAFSHRINGREPSPGSKGQASDESQQKTTEIEVPVASKDHDLSFKDSIVIKPAVRSRVFTWLAAIGVFIPAGYLVYLTVVPGAVDAFSSKYYWIETGLTLDWPGNDFASSLSISSENQDISGPKYTVAGSPVCDADHKGSVAVCWNAVNRNAGYPKNVPTDIPPGQSPVNWCTYKIPSVLSPGAPSGSNPGRTFFCGRAVGR